MKKLLKKTMISNHKVVMIWSEADQKTNSYHVPSHVDVDALMAECVRSYDKYLEHGKKNKKIDVCAYAIKWISKYYQGIETINFDPWKEYDMAQSIRANKEIKKARRNSKLRHHQEDIGFTPSSDSCDLSVDS